MLGWLCTDDADDRLDARNLARLAATCAALFRSPQAAVPSEILFLVLDRLNARNLARLAATCAALIRAPRRLPWRKRCGSAPRSAAARLS